ncbi:MULTISPECIES: hypothetical protein [Mycolicibacterium]|uniref:Uncharacterized protein n=2 Tax=Mycolicibacterium TaxID=1866885 RepID=A0A0U1CYS4_9MYCO|nr:MULTISPECIES: hypothetical protein [Mycolicibacterium]QZH61823.1 hypothetical protein K1X22_09005 [Mycolicibacterium farcinogenes]QZH66462.1 hypothetical protein K6L26_01750 [Mycolicibacterium farcinogenes]CQD02977.1 hypothetical protein BN970_00329 [Mycolicibacterium conceptionense]
MTDHSADSRQPAKGNKANDPPPGPADHHRDGGMATREVAPDVVEKHAGESGD